MAELIHLPAMPIPTSITTAMVRRRSAGLVIAQALARIPVTTVFTALLTRPPVQSIPAVCTAMADHIELELGVKYPETGTVTELIKLFA